MNKSILQSVSTQKCTCAPTLPPRPLRVGRIATGLCSAGVRLANVQILLVDAAKDAGLLCLAGLLELRAQCHGLPEKEVDQIVLGLLWRLQGPPDRWQSRTRMT